MTTDNSADPAKAAKLAQEIVALLTGEDSVTRQRAVQAAMMLMGEIVTSQVSGQAGSSKQDDGDESHADLASFFNREGDMKPADYAQLCAAYHYSMYGPSVFSIIELKAIAADAGVVLPDRVDMTLRNAMQKGKKLFQPSGVGAFKPTATACMHFSEKWKVKPGRKVKPAATKGVADA